MDDEQGMTRSIERVLGQHYKVATTQSSRDAIAVTEVFKPDLAILDVQMPELDGFDLMERLRTIDPELEVIFMTGSVHELDSKLVRAIRKDAFYFLQKPFDREVLLTLVERCLELKRLDQENKKHVLRIEKELAEARAFQQALLPPRDAELGGIKVFARCIPCSELAGDFYDYAAIGTSQAAVLVADVSGHGASAAMLTGIVKSAFHSASVDAYDPASVVQRVSSGIRAFGNRHFITLICARTGKGQLEFVNAGHPPGILLNPESTPDFLESTGPLISPAFADVSWESRTLSLRQNARMLFFTDGVIDAESDSGEYGIARLVAHLQGPHRGDALVDGILESVRQFVSGRPIHDDLTLVVADL